MKRWTSQTYQVLKILFVVIGSAVALLGLLLLTEYFWGLQTKQYFQFHLNKSSSAGLMASLAEVLAGILGLSLTVVAIVVQLASQRYSAKIAELFMKDKVNQIFTTFMVSSCIYIVLLSTFGSRQPSVFAFWSGALLVVLNFGLLLPYFQHVFSFLQPQSIIKQIELSAQRTISRTIANITPKNLYLESQEQVSTSIERIADICLTSIQQKDRNLALHSIRTLERFSIINLERKEYIPDEWFQIGQEMFMSLSGELHRQITDNKIWLEARVLLDFDHILRLNIKNNEMTTQIASSTKKIGHTALKQKDHKALILTIRFFNTYLRHAINAKNVRGIYNILYQYRQLSELLMQAQPEMCLNIVERLVYYGRLCNELKMPFATVTVAHDVQILCKVAYQLEGVDVKPLLERFLRLDQPSEGKSEELALLGVRKAQTLLGAFFLSQGEIELAYLIQTDMEEEPKERLEEIKTDLFAAKDRQFWEITDRGIDFDYVHSSLRPYITKLLNHLLHPHKGTVDYIMPLSLTLEQATPPTNGES